MKTNHRSSRKTSFAVLCLSAAALLGLSLSAQAAAFVRIPNVDGESADANHDKWIDVLAIDWGAHTPGGGATGQSRRRGGAVVEDVTLTIEYEKASPKLAEKCLMGEVIPKLEIELFHADASGRETEPYLTIKLTDVLITSCRLVSGADGPATPSMTVLTLDYSSMTQTHRSRDGEETTLHVEKKGNKATAELEAREPGR